jgi:hypothetical protein
MLGSDRGIIVALIGWLAFVSLISWDAAQQQKPAISCESRAATDKCRPEQYVTERAGIASTFERAISNPQPRTGQDHEKRDLAAQEASAVFAFWMVLISTFGAVVTTLATVLLYQQIRLTREAVQETAKATRAMDDANKIAVQTFKYSAEPIIDIYAYDRLKASGISKKSDVAKVDIDVVLRNIGNGPAIVRVFNVNFVNISDPIEDSHTLETMRKRLEPDSETVYNLSMSWFGGDGAVIDFLSDTTPVIIEGRALFDRIAGPTEEIRFCMKMTWPTGTFQEWGGEDRNCRRLLPIGKPAKP